MRGGEEGNQTLLFRAKLSVHAAVRPLISKEGAMRCDILSKLIPLILFLSNSEKLQRILQRHN